MFTNPTLSSAKSNYKYAKTTVNIRAKPNTTSKIVGQLYWNDKVRVIKKVNKKWYFFLSLPCASFVLSVIQSASSYDLNVLTLGD